MRAAASLVAFCLVAALAACVGCAGPGSEQAVEWDGLIRQSHPRLDAVWVKPDADVVAYRKVMLDPLEVSFARSWSPRTAGGRRLDAREVVAIQDRLAQLFHDVFRKELEGGGYPLVEEPGADTLRVTPAIVNLYVTAPDTLTADRSSVYAANPGSMTLVMELRDSISGELLARVVDTRSGRSGDVMMLTERVRNTSVARSAMRVWASALRRALDELYASEPG